MTNSSRSIALLLLAAWTGCATNEYTGRRQLLLVSEDTAKELGASSYQEILAKSEVATAPELVDPVRRVGHRIAEAAARPDFNWEFNTIVDDKTMNAWCLPGGKIAFYTGIFPVLEDEAGMAFVMGHEVGHALMHHGAERMSQNMVAGGATALVGAYLGTTKDRRTSELAMSAFGVATNVGVLLPFSRQHEAEADRVGLELMAKAGYDPHAAVRVWKKMSSLSEKEPSEWLSTHPSNESRIQDMEARLPEALQLFEKTQPAPVAKLPPIGQHVGKGPAGTPGSSLLPASAQVQAGPARSGTLPDGRKAVQVELYFDRDIFIKSVDISGPRMEKKSIEVNSGVAGGRKKLLTLPLDDAAEAGSYTLTFHGSESGRPVTLTTQREVR
jgi:Zn-dependent protease with chaperone function